MIKPANAIVTLLQSVSTLRPMSMMSAEIIATDAMFTASRNEDIIFEALNLGMMGFNKATNANEGRNIPTVAAIAAFAPSICHPINVAHENTGPGVT
jgi:hypothetical protein